MAKDLAQLEEIFSAALEKSAPAEREAFLNQACGGDTALRQRIERLLTAANTAGTFMTPPDSNQTVEWSGQLQERPGSQIGCYTLLEQIGEGGFGVVFMAEQKDPIRRRVALKIIKLGMDTRQVVARFEAERQALAMMDHPNIAKALDAGATESGRPYFVMELVRGTPITDYCDAHHLPPEQRLELFIHVCQAIQHAHQKGIIHRDIKPSNFLVSQHDDQPLVKVIDFGIAKAMDAKLTERTLFTELRQMIGTPAYMSPEQAGVSDLDVDTRSDIYSLGVLLYELLTGSPPFDPKELCQKALADIQRIIRESDPPKPSTRLQAMKEDLPTVAANRHVEPAKLAQIVRGELDWIVMKCLEKDRARRYETSSGLAMEIRRYLNDEPVLAGPPRAGYRARKFIRRNRGAVIAAGLVAVALVLGIIGTSIGFARAVAARRAETQQRRVAQANELKARTAAGKSEQVAKFLTDMLEGVGPWVAKGRDTTLLKEILNKTNQRAAKELKGQPEVEAAIRMAIGRVYYDMFELDQAEAMQAEALRLARTAFGDEHVEVAAAMHALAETRFDRGDLDGAEKLETQALAMRKKLLGEYHPDVAWSVNRLGRIKHARNQQPEAEGHYLEALAILIRTYGSNHSEVAFIHNNLAAALRDRGAAEESEKMLRGSIDVLRRERGDPHPVVAYQVHNLGTLLCMRGSLAEAESMCREAASTYTKCYGAVNPSTLEAMGDLASVLQYEAKLDEAEAILREALASARTGPAESFRPTLFLKCRLAAVLGDRSRHDEARGIARAAVEECLKQRDPSPGAVSFAFSVMFETLSDAGDSAADLKQELEWLHAKLSRDDPDLAFAFFDTASALLRIHLYAEAASILGECLDICNKTNFPNRYFQAWLKCNATSLLGEAIAESTRPVHDKANQKTPAAADSRSGEPSTGRASPLPGDSDRVARLDEAERLLLAGYDGVKAMPYVFWPIRTCRADCKRRALERIVRLYDLWHAAEPGQGYDTKAAEWRARLAQYQAEAQRTAPSLTRTSEPAKVHDASRIAASAPAANSQSSTAITTHRAVPTSKPAGAP